MLLSGVFFKRGFGGFFLVLCLLWGFVLFGAKLSLFCFEKLGVLRFVCFAPNPIEKAFERNPKKKEEDKAKKQTTYSLDRELDTFSSP